MFERIHRLLERVARVAVWAGGTALMISALIITGDVIARKWIGWTLSGSDEIASYVFAAATTWAYSYCLLHRANIRIDAIYNLLPRAACAILDVLGVSMLFIFIGVLNLRALIVFQDAVEFNSVSITTLTTPLWIPQLFWLSGLIFFMISLVFVLVWSVSALFRWDLRTVRRVAGVLSVEEEIEVETHGTDVRSGSQGQEN
jgi:TRAP-type C4-dicarboxylate transport system permease small subunit